MMLSVGQRNFEAARVFCVGRNYVEHAKELNNAVPERPFIFQKPATALVADGGQVHFPEHGKELHQEVEVVVLIGHQGRARTAGEARSFIAGLSLGIDLTLRDVQEYLKKKSWPWEMAKAFDDSAPIGRFVPLGNIDPDNISFSCDVNGKRRQQGNTQAMIFKIDALIVALSEIWTLLPGDLIYTGTPAGVGPVAAGDVIRAESAPIGAFSWRIVA